AGTTLTLPDVAWLRNKIRDYASAEPEIENA
ncbi:TPA_asm: baseplate protein, partial [Salmonella enterica]|nr:baseplate protein [Salmonella enterica subsp. enterica serovar Litchfield]